MIFVHIGAGAGDQDPGADGKNFRDGFSEFVKSHQADKKEIYVVEANSMHEERLKKCWEDYSNTKFFFIAIVPNNFNQEKLTFYYSEADAPGYQKLSYDANFVKKIYPDTEIKSLEIKTVKINDFMNNNFTNKKIDFFSIDVEGLDFQILMEIDLNKFDIMNISFEYLHLSVGEKGKIIKKLIDAGYSYNGFGIDHNDFDWTFKKSKNKWNNFVISLMRFFHKKRYKHFNKIIKKI